MSSNDLTAIIQARTGSTRLPDKIFEKINDSTVLECLIQQLSYSQLLTNKIIATSTSTKDDSIENFAKSKKIDFFRGQEIDVLDRYYQCAKKFNLKNIIRITADCPFIDPTIIDKVLSIYQSGNYDYVSNFYKNRCPSGFEVEVFSFSCLESSWTQANGDEREHVTKFIYNNPKFFKIGSFDNDKSYPNLHLSVDTKDDLKLISSLYDKIDSKPILLSNILEILNQCPDLLKINNSKF